MWLTLVHILINIKARATKSPAWFKIAHLSFETALVSNVFVVIFYWTFIHFQTIHLEKSDCRFYHYYTTHSLPFLSIILIFLTTEIKLVSNHYPMPLLFSVVYLLFNFTYVKVFGNPQLYWFLSWDNWVSYAISAGILTVPD